MTGVTEIVEAAAAVHGVTPAEVMGRSRERPIVIARHHALFVARERTLWSYESLGRIFDRDQTSVRHAIVSVRRQTIRDPWTRHALDEIRAHLDRVPARA